LPFRSQRISSESPALIGAAVPFSLLLVFSTRSQKTATVRPCPTRLTCATPDEIADALSFALRYQGRKRVNHADDMMARITPERLVQHLEASGFVVMKGRAARASTTANMPPAVE
jgi:hypothetical protein